jgi:hypothetical protein
MKVDIGPYPKDKEGDKPRDIKIEYHDYDIWNLDHTLALIILPGLKKLREEGMGYFHVRFEDIPEEYHKSDTDEDIKAGYEYVMDEMIFAFQSVIDNCFETNVLHSKRINNGLVLFGKYYRSLWD